MATLPLPAPTSHSTPAAGRSSLPSTTDRTSGLVIIDARWAKSATGRPPRVAALASAGVGHDHDRPVVEAAGGEVGQVGAPGDRLARLAQAGGHDHQPVVGAEGDEGGADRLRRGVGAGEDGRHLGPGHVGRHPHDVAGVAGADDGVVPRQAEAGEGEGDRRRGGVDDQAVAADAGGQGPHDAEEPGVARRQHARAGRGRRRRRRGRPGPRPPRRSGRRVGGGRRRRPAGPGRRRRGRPMPGRRSASAPTGRPPRRPTTVTGASSATGHLPGAVEVDADHVDLERARRRGPGSWPPPAGRGGAAARWRRAPRTPRRSGGRCWCGWRRRPPRRAPRPRPPPRPAGRCRPSSAGSGSSSRPRPAW